MRRILLLLTLFLAGCGATSGPVKPVTAVFSENMPLRIVAFPRLPMVYTEMRLSCILPTDVGDGQMVFGVQDQWHSEAPIDKRAYQRLVKVPCETLHVYCGYREHGKEQKLVTLDIEPAGECRDALTFEK